MKKAQKPLAGLFALLSLAAVAVWQANEATARHQQQQLNNSLLAAIPNDNITAVRDLLHQGADPNCQQQPASFQEQFEDVSPSIWRLFHRGEAPNLYLTPLGLAVLNPQAEIVKALLDAGADPNKKDSYGETPRDIDANGQDKIYWMLKAAEAKRKRAML